MTRRTSPSATSSALRADVGLRTVIDGAFHRTPWRTVSFDALAPGVDGRGLLPDDR